LGQQDRPARAARRSPCGPQVITPPAFPPLDGSKLVTGPDDAQLALVLAGKPGTAMASFKQLSDTDLAAVITYTRNSWGNKTGDTVQPAEIKVARQ